MTVAGENPVLFVFVVVSLQLLILLVVVMSFKMYIPVIWNAWSSLHLETLNKKRIVLLIALFVLVLVVGEILGINLFDIVHKLASGFVSKLF